MKDHSIILFDLDGTVTDSGPGIMNSADYALKRLGIEEKDRNALRRFVGPPLCDSFQMFYGLSREDACRAVDIYREYYDEGGGFFENSVYEGMEDALQLLRKAGKKLLIATSKPEMTARRVLEHFGLTKYFYYIAGSAMDGSRVKKADVVNYALANADAPEDRNGVLMVGDREYDVIGARANGLECMGVTYGYGSREELESAGAVYIADSPMDVARQILNI